MRRHAHAGSARHTQSYRVIIIRDLANRHAHTPQKRMFTKRAEPLGALTKAREGRVKQAQASEEEDASVVAARNAPQDVAQVLMTSKNDSILAISWMPTMRYMPEWWKDHRPSVGKVLGVQGSRINVLFDAAGQQAAPMSWRTAFINAFWPLRVPVVPPGFSVPIKSQELKGWIDVSTGEVDLNFDSEFGRPSAPLKVKSRITSEELQGRLFSAVGERIQPDGKAKLVALTAVPKTGDHFQDWFLQLPTDALSILNIRFNFVMKSKSQ